MIVKLAAGAALAAVMAAPAAGETGAAAADPRLGPEVDRICFARNIRNWREVRGEGRVVLLERGVNDWYRVELMGACDASTFRFARTIGLETRPAGGCVGRGDVIIVREAGSFTRRCMISRMYKWNIKAPPPGDDGDDRGGDDEE